MDSDCENVFWRNFHSMAHSFSQAALGVVDVILRLGAERVPEGRLERWAHSSDTNLRRAREVWLRAREVRRKLRALTETLGSLEMDVHDLVEELAALREEVDSMEDEPEP